MTTRTAIASRIITAIITYKWVEDCLEPKYIPAGLSTLNWAIFIVSTASSSTTTIAFDLLEKTTSGSGSAYPPLRAGLGLGGVASILLYFFGFVFL